MTEKRIYSMPQSFMDDKSVPTHWRLLGYVNGFFLNGNEVFAANSTIAAELKVSERSITTAVSRLEELRLVYLKRTKTSRIILPFFPSNEGVKPTSTLETNCEGGVKPTSREGRNELLPNSDNLIQILNSDVSTIVDKEQALVPEENTDEKKEYGNKEINEMLHSLSLSVGCQEFKESKKQQRFTCKHVNDLYFKIGKEEFMERLKGILSDPFKRKNSNSLSYLYGELKSYIHPKEGVKVTEKRKVSANVY